MKGDYVQVIYRTPTGIAVEKVQATRDGAAVETKMPGRNELFITVTELNKAGNPIRTCRFRADDVLATTEGHEAIQRPKKRG